MTKCHSSMDLNQKISSDIPWVISNYQTRSDQCRNLMHTIISELELNQNSHEIIKLYINYYLCELIINYIEEDEVKNFFTIIFPIPLKAIYKGFLKQLLSLSISLNNKQILNALTFYIEKDEINVDENEIKCFPADLAVNCPQFVVTLIDKEVFFDNQKKSKLYTTDLLISWLSGLNSNNKTLKFKAQSLIKFNLYNNQKNSSLLHYNNLEIIQKNLIHNVDSKFLVELSNDLIKLKNNEKIIEKFSQIFILLLQNKRINNFTNSVKKQISLKFSNYPLISNFLQTV